MSETKKKYETEWSFSFGNLGESISNTLSELGVGEDAEIKTSHFVEALEDVTEAKVVLEPTVGQVTVSALADDSDNLFEADVTYLGEIKFEVREEDTRKSVILRQHVQSSVIRPIKDALGSLTRRKELKWDMRLSQRVPLNVQINSGITRNDFDLRGLHLTGLRLNGGTGETNLKLPEIASRYPVNLNSGTGELNVNIPAGSDIDLNANNGTGETNLVIGARSSVSAAITGGIGQCNITVPADAGVRLKATTGLGKVNVPAGFVRIKVDEFVATVGTWETPNYAAAEHRIDIKYDGGIGSLNIHVE